MWWVVVWVVAGVVVGTATPTITPATTPTINPNNYPPHEGFSTQTGSGVWVFAIFLKKNYNFSLDKQQTPKHPNPICVENASCGG